MMTSANPIAISRSRVQTRISFFKEWIAEGAGAEVSGTGVVTVGFWSVLCIFLLLSIYNMGAVATLGWIRATPRRFHPSAGLLNKSAAARRALPARRRTRLYS